MTDPKWLALARKEVGTKEIPGPRSNPLVENYYKEASGMKHRDDVPWCAAFVGAMLTRAGIKGSGSLWARSYLTWGRRLTTPTPGAIAVFSRGANSGHVAFFLEEKGANILVLGGNQNDAVSVEWRPKRRLLGYRWPK